MCLLMSDVLTITDVENEIQEVRMNSSKCYMHKVIYSMNSDSLIEDSCYTMILCRMTLRYTGFIYIFEHPSF